MHLLIHDFDDSRALLVIVATTDKSTFAFNYEGSFLWRESERYCNDCNACLVLRTDLIA